MFNLFYKNAFHFIHLFCRVHLTWIKIQPKLRVRGCSEYGMALTTGILFCYKP